MPTIEKSPTYEARPSALARLDGSELRVFVAALLVEPYALKPSAVHTARTPASTRMLYPEGVSTSVEETQQLSAVLKHWRTMFNSVAIRALSMLGYVKVAPEF